MVVDIVICCRLLASRSPVNSAVHVDHDRLIVHASIAPHHEDRTHMIKVVVS